MAYSSNSTQAATNKKIQGAFMDVKNNGVSAAMKYKDDAESVAVCTDNVHAIEAASRRWRRVETSTIYQQCPHRVTGILKDVFMS